MTALLAGRPDMNTLVGLGASASFGVSCVAALLPRLGWRTFFEEPAMLLGEWAGPSGGGGAGGTLLLPLVVVLLLRIIAWSRCCAIACHVTCPGMRCSW